MVQTDSTFITILTICIVVFSVIYGKYYKVSGSNEATKHEAGFADGRFGLLILFDLIVLWNELLQ